MFGKTHSFQMLEAISCNIFDSIFTRYLSRVIDTYLLKHVENAIKSTPISMKRAEPSKTYDFVLTADAVESKVNV